MKIYFCWKCQQDMPFLNEDEWAKMSPLLRADKETLIQYRIDHDASLKEARENIHGPASVKYMEITGYEGFHFDTISHHRMSDWGPECPRCQYLLRTSKAKLCANCGWEIKTMEGIEVSERTYGKYVQIQTPGTYAMDTAVNVLGYFDSHGEIAVKNTGWKQGFGLEVSVWLPIQTVNIIAEFRTDGEYFEVKHVSGTPVEFEALVEKMCIFLNCDSTH